MQTVGAFIGRPHFGENTLESPTAYTNSKSKIKTLASDHKAITLIALVITIIVMLILVSVTVSIAINGGLFSTAKKAVAETQAATDEEQLYSAVLGLTDANTGKVDLKKLQEQLSDWQIDQKTGKCISPKGNEFMVADYGNIKALEYAKVSDIFDANGKDETAEGYNPNKLHIGDFINYDAGTWTQDEINAIQVGSNDALVKANGSRSVPTNNFEFGGFQAGDSRNGNAIPFKDKDDDHLYDYIKDESEVEITGWRLFDVDGDKNTVTLISAGCPEDYCHILGVNAQYMSEYILAGIVNNEARDLNLTTDYIKRDWSNYVNTTQHAESANAITKTNLDNWYNKYMDVTSADTRTDETFQKIYKTRYENLIDNNSNYWITTGDYGATLRFVYPMHRELNYRTHETASGVRILITLSSDVRLSKIGEKTVKNIYGSNRNDKSCTYNVWNIK